MMKHYRRHHEQMPRIWMVVFVLLAAFASMPRAWAADGDHGGGQGAELTKYLHTHRLPLVSAQLLTNADGTQRVVLYGYTATDFGKQDAVTKSRSYLKDGSISITNRIQVRPELGIQRAAPNPVPGDTAAGTSGEYSAQNVNSEASSQPANPNAANLQNQSQRDIQSYTAQQQQGYRQQPGMGGLGGGPAMGGMGTMGGGSGLTFGSGGMGMGGGGLGALLGMLGGAGGSPSYGMGSPGYGYGSPPGYGSSSYGPPGYGPSSYGSPSYGAPSYPPSGLPYGGNPSGGYPYSADPSSGPYPSGPMPPQP